jgi:O-antigen ligase
MTELLDTRDSGTRGRQGRIWLVSIAVASAVLAAVPVMFLDSKIGEMVLLAPVCLALGACALASPTFAVVLLLLTMFLRMPLSAQGVPNDTYLMIVLLLALSTVLRMDFSADRIRSFGAVEWCMALFLVWNFYSMFSPHRYPAGPQIPDQDGLIGEFSVPRFIVVGTLVPFLVYVVARHAVNRESAVRLVLWTLLAVAGYSAIVSVLQFTGPTELVWPSYIVDIPSYPERAVGVFNHPVANGMVLSFGVAIAMILASHRGEPRWRRVVATVVAVACGWGLFLTHTRAAWLTGVVVLLIGVCLAKRARRGFAIAIAIVTATVLANWSTFVSSDRAAGGVASLQEVDDRLNTIQTALWAAAHKPLVGWGIGRFPAVNTYHHQQWSPDVPWDRGYGIVSHGNELGILAELGAVGLVLWVGVLVLIAVRLVDGYRRLSDDELTGRPIVLIAIMALAVVVGTGLTVDLRFFDYPVVVMFLLAGIAVGCADRHRSIGASAHDERVRTEADHG